MSKFSTGNALRDQAISLALQEHSLASADAPTVESLAPYLPDALRAGEHVILQIEIDGFRAVDGSEATAQPSADVPPAASVAPEPVEMAPEPRREPTKAEISAAEDKLIAAHTALANARADVMAWTTRERAARDKLSRCVTDFQAGFEPYTPDQLFHDHAKAQLEIRRQQAEGTYPKPQHVQIANSAIDESRARRVGPLGPSRHTANAGRRIGQTDTRGTLIGKGARLPSER